MLLMRKQKDTIGLMLLVSVVGLCGCQQGEKRQAPPPDARRPVLKSESELAAEQAERVATGEVVSTTSPELRWREQPAQSERPAAWTPPEPITPDPGAIQADLLIVDNQVITVAEVLYPLWPEIEELRRAQTEAGFRERVSLLVRRETQREIGTLLVYAKALSELQAGQRDMLDAAVEAELERIKARDFGGSDARLMSHLNDHGLTLGQFRDGVSRGMVVQQYMREKLIPLIRPTRGELMAEFRRREAEFSTPATRELLMMEFPFAAYLPSDVTWEQANSSQRAQAQLKAMRAARGAHEELAEKPFADVARAESRGLRVEEGGSWGMIGRPLQPPYEAVTKLVFDMLEGQYSDPTETERGWCIVGCGAIRSASKRDFADVQDELRDQIMEQRFAKLSVDYILDLAEDATISSLGAFVDSAIKRIKERPVDTASSQ